MLPHCVMNHRLPLIRALALASCVMGGGLMGCTTGATPDCDGGDSGCGPGFDGPPIDVATDTANDVAPDAILDVSAGGSPEAGTDASDASSAADVSDDAQG
jgi:hypothetical protein